MGTALVAASFFIRPNVFGEIANVVAVAGFFAIALGVFFTRPDTRIRPANLALLGFVSAASAWAILRSSVTGRFTTELVRGESLTIAAIGAALFAISRSNVRKVFLQTLFALILAISASSVVTALIRLTGAVPLELFHFDAGAYSGAVSFPFTPEVGELTVAGVTVPRSAGLGREPGWGAMYPAVALLAWRLVFPRPHPLVVMFLLAGTLLPLSTSGFGILLAGVFAQAIATPAARSTGPVMRAARVILLPIAAAGVILAALYAPVFGLQAKETQSAASLDARNASSTEGLKALSEGSLGERVALESPDVNILATAASSGWPYVALMLASFALPLLLSRSRRQVAGPVAVIVLTVTLAQPPSGSAFVWILFGAILIPRSTSSGYQYDLERPS